MTRGPHPAVRIAVTTVIALLLVPVPRIPLARASSTWVVTTTGDGGSSCTPADCTLRAAILAANASAGGDLISFAIAPAGRYRIAVTTPLPTITGSDVVLDATTQPGGGSYPIWLDDAGGPGSESGLVVSGSNVTIRGFAITRFDRYGISITSTSIADTIQGNLIGTRDGTADDGNLRDGIHVKGGGQHVIGGTQPSERNIVSGGANDGIELEDSSDNVVVGNYVGVTVDGLTRLPNVGGIEINGNSFRNRIGGTTASERNVVSGNDGIGVQILGSMNADGTCQTPADNLVLGNYLGPDAAGNRLSPYGNRGEGVQLSTCATRNTIGGPQAGASNVISGNRADGVELDGSGGPGGPAGVCGNTVQGNIIGADPTGMVPVPNVDDGIGIDNGACDNLIGGAGTAGNLISGNYNDGIDISRPGSNGNTIEGNVIGLSADGSTVLRNTQNGVAIRAKAQANRISGNVISANLGSGVVLSGYLTEGNVVADNLIGATRGSALRGNRAYGVLITDGPKRNRVEGNRIEGNALDGVAVEKVEASIYSTVGNTLSRNVIRRNGGLGIDLLPADGVNPTDGTTSLQIGNRGLDAPVVTGATAISVRGTAAPETLVEVFTAAPDAGETHGEAASFLGWTTAAGDGTWCLDGVVASGAVTATATSGAGDTSEFSGDVAVSGTEDLCSPTDPEILFRGDFAGPDGSVPAGWEVRRSASGASAGATILDDALMVDVVLATDQTGWQYVQAGLTAFEPTWAEGPIRITWTMSTAADAHQTVGLVLTRDPATRNAATLADHLRVRVGNGRLALLESAGGSTTTLWSGPLPQGGLRTFALELAAGSARLFVDGAPMTGDLPRSGTWSSGHIYLHASTDAQQPHRTTFDTLVVSGSA